MRTYFQTSEGDMFPFSSVIRVAYKPNGYNWTRVYFINGCIDLDNTVDGDFYNLYEEWLGKFEYLD